MQFFKALLYICNRELHQDTLFTHQHPECAQLIHNDNFCCYFIDYLQFGHYMVLQFVIFLANVELKTVLEELRPLSIVRILSVMVLDHTVA